MGKICYFCPDFSPPSAGTKRLYRHVRHLNLLGYDARVVHQKKGFILNWHEYRVPVLWIEDQPGFEKDDILVFPEGMSALMKETRHFPCIRIAIALNWAYVYSNLPKGENWCDYGINHVITPSPVIKDFLEWSLGVNVTLIANYVDLHKFIYRPERKLPKIAYMSRKDLSGEILRTIFERKAGPHHKFQWARLHDLTENQYAAELTSSALFLATSPQEGMPTSVLEAMAAGCLILGYSGVGGNDYLVGEGHHQNCILIENGNYPALGKKLEDTLMILQNNPDAFQRLITNGIETAQRFQDPEEEANSLDAFYSHLCRLGSVSRPPTEAIQCG
jgi:glycosyltransferase involved in cell wall biosynthesis